MAFGPKGAVIVAVDPQGPASAAGLAAGDELLLVNGRQPMDLMDLLDQASSGQLELRYRRGQAELSTKIHIETDEPLGLEFSDTLFNRVKTCRNKCVFCFMDQMPKKMRPSLYYRDDDYRLSNLHGNFITLTNLSPEEWERIRVQRVSPLYVSVHATDDQLREELLGSTRQARMGLMSALRQLIEWGIELHTQIVLMPGLNDGDQLERSLADLFSLVPHVKSIAVVPVGLTRYRAHLPMLKPVTRDMIAPLVAQVGRWQTEGLQRWGEPLVYLADEMYLIGGLPLPPHRHYGDYAQAENGVGMVRRFVVDVNRRLPRLPSEHQARWLMVTGEYGGIIFPPLIEKVTQRVQGLEIRLTVVTNEFFGPLVKCSGLLAGRDILAALEREADYLALPGTKVMIPGVALKDAAVIATSQAELFLDDLPMQGLADRFGVPMVNGGSLGAEWLDALTGRGHSPSLTPNREHPTPLEIVAFPEHTAKV